MCHSRGPRVWPLRVRARTTPIPAESDWGGPKHRGGFAAISAEGRWPPRRPLGLITGRGLLQASLVSGCPDSTPPWHRTESAQQDRRRGQRWPDWLAQ
jgi:hypothetical protein